MHDLEVKVTLKVKGHICFSAFVTTAFDHFHKIWNSTCTEYGIFYMAFGSRSPWRSKVNTIVYYCAYMFVPIVLVWNLKGLFGFGHSMHELEVKVTQMSKVMRQVTGNTLEWLAILLFLVYCTMTITRFLFYGVSCYGPWRPCLPYGFWVISKFSVLNSGGL